MHKQHKPKQHNKHTQHKSRKSLGVFALIVDPAAGMGAGVARGLCGPGPAGPSTGVGPAWVGGRNTASSKRTSRASVRGGHGETRRSALTRPTHSAAPQKRSGRSSLEEPAEWPSRATRHGGGLLVFLSGLSAQLCGRRNASRKRAESEQKASERARARRRSPGCSLQRGSSEATPRPGVRAEALGQPFRRERDTRVGDRQLTSSWWYTVSIQNLHVNLYTVFTPPRPTPRASASPSRSLPSRPA